MTTTFTTNFILSSKTAYFCQGYPTLFFGFCFNNFFFLNMWIHFSRPCPYHSPSHTPSTDQMKPFSRWFPFCACVAKLLRLIYIHSYVLHANREPGIYKHTDLHVYLSFSSDPSPFSSPLSPSSTIFVHCTVHRAYAHITPPPLCHSGPLHKPKSKARIHFHDLQSIYPIV